MKAIHFAPGWIDQVEPGKPFRMKRGIQVKDQVSHKRLREHGKLYTVQQVAERLQVKPDTVYEWVEKGHASGIRLGFFRVGRHLRISEEHIEEFIRCLNPGSG
jgi:excisionase family DNA binding protein